MFKSIIKKIRILLIGILKKILTIAVALIKSTWPKEQEEQEEQELIGQSESFI